MLVPLVSKLLTGKGKRKKKKKKMLRRRNNIVLVKRDTPKKVTLPNGRTFYGKYRRVTALYLPGGTTIARTYKGRPVQARPIKAPARAKPANAVRPRARAAANALLNIARTGKARSRASKGKRRKLPDWLLKSGQKGSGRSDIARSVANSPFAQDITKKLISKGINSIPSLFKRGSKKIKNNIAQSEIMSDIVNEGTRTLHGGIGF